MATQISILGILKQSGKFNLVNFVSNILSVPKSIIIAMVLVPGDYGIINLLALWSLYAGLIHPGLTSAGNREIAHLIGGKNNESALRVQNVSITSDLIYSLVPFMAILCAVFFAKEMTLKIGFIFTALTYASAHLAAYMRGVNFARQHFSIVARGDFIQSVSVVFSTLALVFWLKIYAVLIGPLVGALLAWFYYLKRGSIGFRFNFDWQETVRLFKIGISFSILALVYWAYQFADKTVIAFLLPRHQLGLYSYALVYIFLGLTFLRDFGNVFAPVLWAKAGQEKNNSEVFYATKRVIIYLAITTAMLIPFSQVCFYLLTNFLTKNFVDSIPVFIVLSCNLYWTVLSIIPSLILQSSAVNRQASLLKAYMFGFSLNVCLDIIAIRMGYGILAVAVINVITQAIVTVVNFLLIRKYIFRHRQDVYNFIRLSGMPLLVSIVFCCFHNYFMNNDGNRWFFASLTLTIQLVLWFSVIRLFYRDYFPKEKVRAVIREFGALSSRFFWGISSKFNFRNQAAA